MAYGGGSVGNTLITNGATLEDCHTNVFVLTELTGLKWCRYSAGHTDVEVCTDVCEDPILRAYSGCLKEDLLCVWRRVPTHPGTSTSLVLHSSSAGGAPNKIDLRLAAEKELWVFWYGEEQPIALKTICASLTRCEEASWDKGVEYETRSLLFKALHSLIERSLLQRDYVRLGQWFVQPLCLDEVSNPPKYLLAFNFSFFVHGENNVCVSVTVQRQPPVCRLSRSHLAKRETGLAQRVLLAPFCVAATLSRQCHLNFDSDNQLSKLWREWSEFYPLPDLDSTENMGYVDANEKERQDQLRALAPPRMVEVVVNGVRLKYPAAYVLVECASAVDASGVSSGAVGGDKAEQSRAAKLADGLATAAESDPAFSGSVLQRAAEELVCSAASTLGRRPSQTGSSTPTPESQQQEETVLSWEIVDTAQKEPCICSAAPKATTAQMKFLNKAQLKFGYTTSPTTACATAASGSSAGTGLAPGIQRHQRLMERQTRFGKSGPFHRRQGACSGIRATSINPALSTGAMPSSAPTSPMEKIRTSLGSDAACCRPITTPVTPVALAPASSLSCHNLPAASSSCDALSLPATSMISSVYSTKMLQSSQTANFCPTMSSSSAVLVLKSEQNPAAVFERCKRRLLEAGTYRRLWKRPRLGGSNGSDSSNVGLGSQHAFKDETAVSPPSYSSISSQGWCTRKSQKHDLANLKPFSTPGANLRQQNGEQYFPPFAGLSKIPSSELGHLAMYSETPAIQSDFGVGSGSAAAPTTSPLMAGTDSAAAVSGNKSGHVGLPENIMEDSPTDNMSSEFLSPPPSHPREEENQGQHVTSRQVFGNHLAASTMPSTNLVAAIAAKSQYDMIYPTPPSIEAPTMYALGQFSPEANVVVVPASVHRPVSPAHQLGAFNDHQSILKTEPSNKHNGNSYASHNGASTDIAYRSSFVVARQPVQSQEMSAVVENGRVAKYLLAETYAPKGLTNRQLTWPSSRNGLSLPFWKKSDPRQMQLRAKSMLGQPHSSVMASPFFAYSSPGQQSTSGPGSPIAALPPPPPYGLQKVWPSPAAVGSPFSIRAGGPKTPASVGCAYDIQSPVSNASSSFYHRNDNSIDAATTIGHTPGSAISSGEGAPAPEGHGLVLSLLMCDTVANLFRDSSFDSCPLCVCSMGIMGVDAGVYIVASKAAMAAASARQMSNSLPSTLKCTCGFSAVRYRSLSWRAGLFYEDEYEATGVWPSPKDSIFNQQQQRDNHSAAIELMNLVRYKAITDLDLTTDNRLGALILRNQSGIKSNSDSTIVRYVHPTIELRDLTEMCNQAVEQACLMMDCTKPSRDDFHQFPSGSSNRYFVGDWGYMKATHQSTNLESCFIMRTLSPILQEAMQKSRGGGAWQTVKQQHGTTVEGPLTWRHLHRKCLHRTTNDWSGPEPVPWLLLATDREWITVSPFALRSWDRLPLEPYGQQKDVAYIALVPDNGDILSKSRQFFRSLGKMYEALRLGRHCPITRALKDGIMAVKKDYATQRSHASIDSSFDQMVEEYPRLGSKLKLYAQVCRDSLSPHLVAENVFDKSIFRDGGKDSMVGSSSTDGSSMPPPSTFPGKEDQNSAASGASSLDNDGNENEVENSPIPHTVVIYIVDAFTFGAADHEDPKVRQLAAVGLHRCYLEILHDLPDPAKSSVQVEVIPLQTIFETSFSEVVTGCSQPDYLRRLAFSIFQQPRCVDFSCITSTVSKPLTGFGTAASRLELIRRRSSQQNENGRFGNYYRAHCPPVILAPVFEKNSIALNSDVREESSRVLFISYCLSEHQEWLLATATDHQGFLLEDCVIDMRVSNRRCVTRRPVSSSGNRHYDQGPEGSMIWESLRKLWSFVTALLASGTHPWRLVVGRLGRLGHEELKAWAHFLCRSKLRMTTRLIRERCGMCAAMPSSYDTPTILSACLISTEPDPSLRIFPNSFTHDDRFGQGGKYCPLATPEDVSCTHVMVFPTSAAILMAQSVIPGSVSGGQDGDADDFDVFGDLGMDAEFPELGDVFGDEAGRSLHQQPALAEAADESIQLQPLALGYLVSTAPPGWLPDWFWTNRPSGRSEVPVHLRSSLHIHTSGVQQSDEQLLQATSNSATAGGGFGSGGSRSAAHSHPLDSSLTTDVLRYVLETYNSLSWLTFDTKTGDRRSCMPVHIQHLCRLYRAMDGFEFSSAAPSSSS